MNGAADNDIATLASGFGEALENNQDRRPKDHGGARKGAGRKAGSATKRTRVIADRALEEGISPLEYMLKVMRTEPPDTLDSREAFAAHAMRFEAAKAAAPYIHPRLAAIEHTGADGKSLLPAVLNVVIGSEPKDSNASS